MNIFMHIAYFHFSIVFQGKQFHKGNYKINKQIIFVIFENYCHVSLKVLMENFKHIPSKENSIMSPISLSSSFKNYQHFFIHVSSRPHPILLLYGHTTICLSNYLLKDILPTTNLTIMSKTAAIIYLKFFFSFLQCFYFSEVNT